MKYLGVKKSFAVWMAVVCATALIVTPVLASDPTSDECIELTKIGPEEPVVPGAEITYSFEAANNCGFALKSGIQCYDEFLGGLIWDNELEVGEVKSFDRNHIVTAEDCRDYEFTNEAWCNDGTMAAISNIASWIVFCDRCEPSGTGTPGYWKNHPEAWPVDSITVGGIEYSKDLALVSLDSAVRGDKTITMFKALVAAMLNVAGCNDGDCVTDTIALADAWMTTYGPVGAGVKANSSAWQQGEPLYELLDDYNNGFLCAPARD